MLNRYFCCWNDDEIQDVAEEVDGWGGLGVKVFGNVENSRCYLGHPWMVPRTMAKPWVKKEYSRQVTNSRNE